MQLRQILSGREDASNATCNDTLLENELPSVIACTIEEGDYLVVSFLSPRVLAITDSDRSFRHVDIRPFYPADLSLTHCSRDCEANNSSERYKLLWIGLRVEGPPHRLAHDRCSWLELDEMGRMTYERGVPQS